ncbi:hypothetical protein UFOVP116_132 [uncultured Caudovirales phage]|uniref:Uncharacterized protein n=1 Tax=uncultured Caudovirales phage TaxID=2100421 RepID=A0A6J5L6U8_9CAUD|nr:hypothetical protein UFOVP116_132 [uncultured Caudovirales phage]
MLDYIVKSIVRSVMRTTKNKEIEINGKLASIDVKMESIEQQLMNSIVGLTENVNAKLDAVQQSLAQQLIEINLLKQELDTLKNPPPIANSSYLATILFPNPLCDSKGVPLRGTAGECTFDFTVGCISDNDLTIMNFSPEMSSATPPNCINLEVIGAGVMSVMLKQTITVNGVTTTDHSCMCTLTVHPECSEYVVNDIKCCDISTLKAYATAMTVFK